MAQLPPRVPNIFTHDQRRTPSMGPFGDGGGDGNNSSWADEFLDFSSFKRGSHRRSVSDSAAFLENPALGDAGGFDDDQLMYLFADDVPSAPVSSSNLSSPASKQNNESEAQSDCKVEMKTPTTAVAMTAGNYGDGPDSIVDPKRVKRILANRQSAQRSRVRKLQYISELEISAAALQTEVSALSPRVAFLDHQRSILTVGNSHLKQRIAALAQDKIFKDARQEALKKEIERLRQVYHQQNLKKMVTPTSEANALRIEKELVS